MDEKNWLWGKRSVSDRLCHFLALWPQSSLLTSLSFSFFIQKGEKIEIIISTSQSRLDTHSMCLVNGSCDYCSQYCPFCSPSTYNITQVIVGTKSETTVTFLAFTIAWKEPTYLLGHFRVAAIPLVVQSQSRHYAKRFICMISNFMAALENYVFSLSNRWSTKRFVPVSKATEQGFSRSRLWIQPVLRSTTQWYPLRLGAGNLGWQGEG